MNLSQQTITSFQEMYWQINAQRLSSDKTVEEIKKLYEGLILIVMNLIPVTDKEYLQRLSFPSDFFVEGAEL